MKKTYTMVAVMVCSCTTNKTSSNSVTVLAQLYFFVSLVKPIHQYRYREIRNADHILS